MPQTMPPHDAPRTIALHGDGYTMSLTLPPAGDPAHPAVAGMITSDLLPPEGSDAAAQYEAEFPGALATERPAVDAIEALVLAHALEGINVSDPRYVAGLDTALNAVFA